MNPIQRLREFIQIVFSDARVTLDQPIMANGVWSMNVFLPGYHLGVAWQDGKGFGVVADDAHGYGEGADEVFDSYDHALPRIIKMLVYRLPFLPPSPIGITPK